MSRPQSAPGDPDPRVPGTAGPEDATAPLPAVAGPGAPVPPAPRRPRRRRRGRRAAAGLAGLLVLGAGGTGAWWLSEGGAGPLIGPEVCLVTGSDGVRHRLTPDRAAIAGVIASVAQEKGLPARAATIGIATGIQESGLRNLDHGDQAGPDSRGVFQQRPSQGWGTQAEVMDPVHAAGAFFDELVRMAPDYAGMSVTDAAQAVQRSAYPDAYADHEAEARAWASALTGQSPEQLRCRLASPSASDAAGFAAEAARERPSVTWRTAADGTLTAQAGGAAPTGATARSLAVWAVVNARQYGVRRVEAGDLVWERSGSGGLESRPGAGVEGVRVTF